MADAPVRLSANGEYGFPTVDDKSCVRLTIDGDSRRLVIAYDMEAGWVETVRADDRGNPVIHDGAYLCQREYGSIVAVILS